MADLLEQPRLDLLSGDAFQPGGIEVDAFTTIRCSAGVCGHEAVHGCGIEDLEADLQAGTADGGLQSVALSAGLHPENLQQQGVVGL